METMKITPNLKKAYPIVYTKNSVLIGGFGTVSKYDDPDGAVTQLFKLINGKNTIKAISLAIQKSYPQYNTEDIMELINDLNKEHYIEGLSHIGSKTLDNYALKRYHRNINFFSSYIDLDQNKYLVEKKIQNTRIGILGLGGLGSHIVYDLAGLGFGYIHAVDFDTVDLTNLNRQILYNENDIGKEKGLLAKKRITDFNSHVQFNYTRKKISSSQDLIDIFNDVDLLICVADRPKYQLAQWINEAIIELNIPLFCAGLEAHRAMHYTIIPHITGCIQCWRNETKNDNPVTELFLSEKKRKNLTGDNTAIFPLVSTITGHLCVEILKYVTKIGQLNSAGKLVSVDFDTMQSSVSEEWLPDPKCTICGGA
ncbi:HesA/MoeB/ThiF family protein [Lactiplantibacillus plantarum]|uniref:HesA/MoeB/ThiF family protein n=1 Tax=Lactiplantibacillus plantarum TaxID=1590 RepID=UPI001BA6E9E5|nr:ThiF family adenylyltransferase [Lactiplantibacillus plantarum]MBS0938083.1 ThiF family adenylyltransferase [Lactiplantibacillus plantarum]MBS0946053.1 ThiF family adenylyltransferase [Lactiplantibacillus plantarum]